MSKLTNPPPQKVDHFNGGNGHVILQAIAGPDILKDKCRLYMKRTLEKGCSIGFHPHRGDEEIYYILSGHGLYTNKAGHWDAGPGDALFCPNGDSHSIVNAEDTDLVMIGLVIYDTDPVPVTKKEGTPMLEKLPPKIIEHANGGKGRIILQPIAGPEILKDKCRLYVKCTLEKGCSMGVHQHKGDGEIYYILSGHGLYTDNDSTYEVVPGDATFCKNGDRHGLENIGNEDLVFMGLIIYDK